MEVFSIAALTSSEVNSLLISKKTSIQQTKSEKPVSIIKYEMKKWKMEFECQMNFDKKIIDKQIWHSNVLSYLRKRSMLGIRRWKGTFFVEQGRPNLQSKKIIVLIENEHYNIIWHVLFLFKRTEINRRWNWSPTIKSHNHNWWIWSCRHFRNPNL